MVISSTIIRATSAVHCYTFYKVVKGECRGK